MPQSFNSTLVRFKQDDRPNYGYKSFMFQFHSGSIQTAGMFGVTKIDSLVSIPLWFDSNGVESAVSLSFKVVSIPLWFDSNWSSALVRFQGLQVSIPLWFDSNKVRNVAPTSSPRCFNSTLVRFKPNKFGFLEDSEGGFQFHSGSIQTCSCYRSWSAQHRSFNSTLVRFKPARLDMIKKESERFNSTLVRFKHVFVDFDLAALNEVSIPLWFDSNGQFPVTCTVEPEFQFHSGSIQTELGQNVDRRCAWFQFHSGSIQTCVACRRKGAGKCVSIPLWFDSNDWQAVVGRCLARCFNSTLVRFKLMLTLDEWNAINLFQFHSGSIQTPSTLICN